MGYNIFLYKKRNDKIVEIAASQIDKEMKGLHVLHNPDLVAGGFRLDPDQTETVNSMTIAECSEDNRINSSIGSHWNTANKKGSSQSRVEYLEAEANKIDDPNQRMNVVLKVCP